MLDEVAFATGKAVHPIVVPEARLWALLRDAYGVERQLRGIDVDFESLRRTRPAAPAAPAVDRRRVGGPHRRATSSHALYARTGGSSLEPAAPGATATPTPDEDVVELTELLLPEDDAPPVTAEVLASLARAPGHAPPARFVAPPPRSAEPEPSPLSFDEALRLLEGVTERGAIARTVLRLRALAVPSRGAPHRQPRRRAGVGRARRGARRRGASGGSASRSARPASSKRWSGRARTSSGPSRRPRRTSGS